MAFARSSWRTLSAALGLVLLLDGCSRDAEQKPAPAPPAAPTAPVIPAPSPPLGRAELLDAIEAVAAATAAAAPYPQAAAALADRRFQLRLPFGCRGPAPETARLGYRFDAEERVLRLGVRPEVWTNAAWAREMVGSPQTEAIEGFWISRPWTDSEACPAMGPAPAGAAAPPPSPETVGLAQVFEKGGSRLERRGERPYEVTRKLEADEVPGVGGFRLVLEGRIAGDGQGRPIRCRSEHADRRPVCLARVEIDRVAIEDAGGQTLAEWRS